MSTIPQFQAIWLDAPIDIVDNENGTIQVHSKVQMTTEQTQMTINYLILEGFIRTPKPPVDDYQLSPHF